MSLCWRARDNPWCSKRFVRVCYAHTRIVITMDKNSESHWELYPHEADMGVRGIGPSLEAAFAQAGLALTAGGEGIDMARQQPGVEVKGATYTDLAVRRDEHGRWIAQCVVDV